MAKTANVAMTQQPDAWSDQSLAIPVLAPPDAHYDLIKRGIDLLIGGVMLLVALPIIAVLAVLCKLDSAGPVLFRQRRLARGGRLFALYKFRTMYSDSRERFPELFDFTFANHDQEAIYLQFDDDPRVTRLGRFLRRSSLDELPNLFNVVRGDMSLVGPRPEIPEMLPHYTAATLAKFAVHPGLTGVAQITGRGDLNFAETVRCDLAYCRQRSLRYDLSILLKTVQAVVKGAGAY